MTSDLCQQLFLVSPPPPPPTTNLLYFYVDLLLWVFQMNGITLPAALCA